MKAARTAALPVPAEPSLFAEQVSEVKAYEPELRHGDAVKGLHLYGAKIVYPKEMVFLNLKPATEDAI